MRFSSYGNSEKRKKLTLNDCKINQVVLIEDNLLYMKILINGINGKTAWLDLQTGLVMKNSVLDYKDKCHVLEKGTTIKIEV